MGRQNKQEQAEIYRISLIEDHTHRQIRAIRFTKMKFVVAAVTAAVIGCIAVFCIIGFTPLKTLVPGYPDAHFRREAIANAIAVDSLENAITRWKIYADNISRVLQGTESLELDSLMKGTTTKYLSDRTEAELAKEDSLLRLKVDKKEQFEVRNGTERDMPIEGRHFFVPLKGVISQGFEPVLHPAIDITAPANSVVMAVLDGTVVYEGWTNEKGYVIAIQHEGDILTIYSDNQKLLKKSGDKVVAGSPIALVGSASSLTKGDHLHFELWYKGEALDATKFISF